MSLCNLVPLCDDNFSKKKPRRLRKRRGLITIDVFDTLGCTTVRLGGGCRWLARELTVDDQRGHPSCRLGNLVWVMRQIKKVRMMILFTVFRPLAGGSSAALSIAVVEFVCAPDPEQPTYMMCCPCFFCFM